jgi:replicative DNA helicase
MRTSPSAALARCTARQKGATLYREAPHNIEAEQALLGAILVNNQAYHQVSGSLESRHFFEPLHQHIFEVSAELIRNGRIANAITLKDYFAADQRIADLTPTQYLARLSAEATSIIGAVDYARTISDLHTRRCLIVIGEKTVDQSYDAPVDFSAQLKSTTSDRVWTRWPRRPDHHGSNVSRNCRSMRSGSKRMSSLT